MCPHLMTRETKHPPEHETVTNCMPVSGLLASVPSTNGNGNGGMMAYSPGDQQTGTNNNSHSESVHKLGVSMISGKTC